MQPDYSPRGFGRILDRAFELYRANFRTIALTALIVLFPLAMLVGVTQVFSTRGILAFFGNVMSNPTDPDAFFGGEYARIQQLSMLSNMIAPLFLAARTYLVACLLTVAPAMLAGEKPGVRETLKAGRSRFLWLLLATVAVSFSVSAGLVVFLVPGILLWARLRVVGVVTVIERVPLDRAFSRSWSLTRDRFWRTVGFAIVLGILAVVVEAAIDSPAVIRQIVASANSPEALFQELSPGWQTFEGVLAAASTALIAPFLELSWFSYYLDLRARAEGLDLVVAARERVVEGPFE